VVDRRGHIRGHNGQARANFAMTMMAAFYNLLAALWAGARTDASNRHRGHARAGGNENGGIMSVTGASGGGHTLPVR
jgi:hypothetical protein